MTQMQNHESNLSRRAFLRWSALGMGAVAIAACAPVGAPAGETGSDTEAPAGAITEIVFLT